MKRRRVLIIMAVVFAVAVLAVVLWPGEREPEYQGKKLSEWLEIYCRAPGGSDDNPPEKMEAFMAVSRIGTNALPWLIKWVYYEPSALKRKSLDLMEKTSYSSKIKHRIYPGEAEERRNFALSGLTILGKNAVSAIPEMVRIMNVHRADPDWAMLVIGCLGDYGLPSLVEVITNRANPNALRTCALKYVHWDCTNSGWAVEPLVQCLQEDDSAVVAGAARAIGQLGQQPRIAVPALTERLNHPDFVVRMNVLYGLGSFRGEARSALPALTNLLADGQLEVRKGATNVLRKIAPEALTNGVSGH